MKINKIAYCTISYEYSPPIIGEIQLYNKYILSLTINENLFASGLNITNINQRIPYNIEFLDRHSKDFPSAQNFAKISYNDTAGIEKSIYIKINIIEKFQLKWVFKKTFIQNHYQFWLPILISFSTAAFTLMSNNSIENKLTKIDILDSIVKYNQEEIILLQQKFSNIKSSINDSILLKKDSIILKN